MSVEHQLSKLTAKTTNYSGARGGIPEITPEMVSAARHGLTPLQDNLIARIYLLDYAVNDQLERQVYIQIGVDMAVKRRWRIPKGREYVRQMSRLALNQVVCPGVCPKCNTLGWLYDNKGKEQVCAYCNGTGRFYLHDKIKPEQLGMSFSRWDDVWRKRFNLIYHALMDQEAQAKRVIRDALRG